MWLLWTLDKLISPCFCLSVNQRFSVAVCIRENKTCKAANAEALRTAHCSGYSAHTHSNNKATITCVLFHI